ncbi:MAG: cell division protein FtsQ/DivIB [Ectothiorhodospiraceae bacterium]|nr:cell division protein FtsQ/DivIB [Ectothiorhodospiraceae bacterium]
MGARRVVAKKPKKARIKPVRPLTLKRWSQPLWLTRRLVGGAMLFGVLGGVVTSGVWTLLQADTLPIEHVQVNGAFKYLERQDLFQAIGELAEDGFFSVDVRAVKQASEALAWVDRASVRRVWPNILQVDIIEHVPLAKWKNGGIVNRRGEVIAAAENVKGNEIKTANGDSEFAALPIFSGPEGSAEQLSKRYQSMSLVLAELGLGISTLSISERRAWKLSLNNGLQLLLGRTANDTQLARFARAYEKVLAKQVQQIQSIDLRYTNGFAVRLRAEVG